MRTQIGNAGRVRCDFKFRCGPFRSRSVEEIAAGIQAALFAVRAGHGEKRPQNARNYFRGSGFFSSRNKLKQSMKQLMHRKLRCSEAVATTCCVVNNFFKKNIFLRKISWLFVISQNVSEMSRGNKYFSVGCPPLKRFILE
jgi:hypothetical protein